MLLVKLALRKYEESLCSCGHSALLSHGREGVGEYERETSKCHACAALDEDKAKPRPGVKRYVRDRHDDPRDEDEPEEDTGADEGGFDS